MAAFGAIRVGRRPARAHAYAMVTERSGVRCLLVLGRELRDDWEGRTLDDTPAAVRVLARAEARLLPLGEGSTEERLGRFRAGFHRVVSESQRELQERAAQRHGEAPSLTLTLAYLEGLRLYVGHVGDDRCYVARGDRLHRMTTDQTAASASSEPPLVHDPALSRKLLNVVGGFSDDLDTQTLSTELVPNDLVFLCTPEVGAVVSDAGVKACFRAATASSSIALETLAEDVFRAVPESQPQPDLAIGLARVGAPE